MRRKRLAYRVIAAIAVVAAATIACCGLMLPKLSVKERDSSAGFNGSFEVVKSGFPVNWNVHYQPIKKGDAVVSFDTSDFIDGSQSLKIVAHRAKPPGGWGTAGIFQLFRAAKPNHSYKLSFWLKNQGCKVRLYIGSEKYQADFHYPKIDEVFGEEEPSAGTWRRFEYEYTVPDDVGNIRFELNILAPGTLWVDDVRIDEVQTE